MKLILLFYIIKFLNSFLIIFLFFHSYLKMGCSSNTDNFENESKD